MILAGGFGTRLRSAVSDRPKPMAEVRGRPFLAYLIDQLEEAGFETVTLCTGYRAEQIEEHFGRRQGKMTLRHSREMEPLGTGGALRMAVETSLESGPVLVMNGDSYLDIDLKAFCSKAMSILAEASFSSLMSTLHLPDTSRYGRVEVDGNGRIVAFCEKTGRTEAGWINGGIYAFPRELLRAIPQGRAISLEREVIPDRLSDGIFAFPCHGRFIDIGTPESLLLAAEVLPLPAWS